MFRTGALVSAAGLLGGLLLGTAEAALVGVGLFGLGLATLLPISISAAGEISQLPVSVAVARVSMLGYLGAFAGPALIGLLASRVGLGNAMLVPALVVGATALAARRVRAVRGR